MLQKSESIKIMSLDFKEIYDSIISLSLYEYINSAVYSNKEKFTFNTELDIKIFEHTRKFEKHNYLYNSLYISLVAILETYLKNRLIEEIEVNLIKCETLVLKYNLDRKFTPTDVINGPKFIAKEILNSVIYHKLPTVNILYKIIFDIDILKLLGDKKIFEIIKIRHKIVHQSGRINEKKIFVREYTILKNMTLIDNWLQNIDFMILNNQRKKSKINYLMRFGNYMSKMMESKIFEEAYIDRMQNSMNNLDEIVEGENEIGKNKILII